MTSRIVQRFPRAELERHIEEMIALLDLLDGDCDLEDDPAESGVADDEALSLMRF